MIAGTPAMIVAIGGGDGRRNHHTILMGIGTDDEHRVGATHRLVLVAQRMPTDPSVGNETTDSVAFADAP